MYCQNCKNDIHVGDNYFSLDHDEHIFCSSDCLDEYLFYSGRLVILKCECEEDNEDE